MSLVERIKIFIDVDADGATRPLQSFRTSLSEAEGFTGKFKVAGGAAMGFVKDHAVQMSAAAAGAFAGFALKGVQAFTDIALEAGKFSETAGIAVEDASRLQEVAGDLGVKAGAVEGAMTKMNLAIANGKQPTKDFADQIVLAKDGTVDSYNSFINLATSIGAIKDPTLRAKAAQETFGKSYGEISEMMSMSAETLRTKLDGVSEAKVITPEELDKARRYREAMDNLKDVIEDVQLALGENLTPILADAAGLLQGASDVADKVTGGSGGLGKLYEWSQKIFSPLSRFKDAIGGVIDTFNGGDLEGKISATAFAQEDLAGESDAAALALQEAGNEAAIAAGKSDRLKESVETLTEKWQILKGNLDDRQAFLNLEGSFEDLKAKGAEAWDAAKNGAEDATTKSREYELATIDAKQKVIDYLAEVLKLPPERSTNILAAYDQGQFDWVESQLAILTRNRTMNVDIQARGGVGYAPLNAPRKAKGGPVGAGEAVVVGDNPDGSLNSTSELIVPQGDSNVVSAPDIRRALGASQPVQQYVDNSITHISLPAGSDPKAVLAAQRKYRRIQGPT